MSKMCVAGHLKSDTCFKLTDNAHFMHFFSKSEIEVGHKILNEHHILKKQVAHLEMIRVAHFTHFVREKGRNRKFRKHGRP